ncbi:hypothetical protein OYC64_019073 [Pagothenia borchgrevinki]|uniref:Secreted protein n=1 Tax=Pagothenia borchgrevinki TaxID=8213 RepID=A0ABD2GQR0_PAGBO
MHHVCSPCRSLSFLLTKFRSFWPIVWRGASAPLQCGEIIRRCSSLREGTFGGKILDLGDRSGKTPTLLPRYSHRVTLPLAASVRMSVGD